MAQLTVETIDQVLDGVIAQRASNLDLWHITFIKSLHFVPLSELKVRKAEIRRRRIWLLFVLTTWVLLRINPPTSEINSDATSVFVASYLVCDVTSNAVKRYIKLQHED